MAGTLTTPEAPRKTWKPTTAGILSIIAGGLNLVVGVIVSLRLVDYDVTYRWDGFFLANYRELALIAGAVLIVIGIISILGGSSSLRRRVWGLALAGSILALFPPPIIVLGILSIIFVASSKGEFH